MGMGYNKSKFVLSETFNNKDGKTSGSGFIGVILGLIAGGGFIAGTVGFFFSYDETIEYLRMVLNLVAASTILLGVRKVGAQIMESRTKSTPPEAVADSLFQSKPNDNEKG